MKGANLGRWFVTAALAVIVGCGGQPSNKFSTDAIPIAIKMRESIAKTDTSTLAGQLERAREFFNSRAITENDLKLFLKIHDYAHANNWNEAKKVLEEGLASS